MASVVGLVGVADEGEGVDRLLLEQDVDLHEVRGAEADVLVVERSVAARAGFQPVVEVEDEFRERHVVGQAHALRRDVVHADVGSALLLAELHRRADELLGHEYRELYVRLANLLDAPRVREVRGTVRLYDLAVRQHYLVDDVRRGRHEVDAELAVEPLLRNLHVQQAEEAAAEAEAERRRVLRLEAYRRIIYLQLLKRLAQLVDVLALDGVEAAEDDGLHLLVSRERLGGWRGGVRYRVADVGLVYRLYARADESDLAGAEAVDLHHVRLEYADLVELVRLARRHEADCLSRLERAVDDAHVADDALVVVVDRVENQRLKRRVRVARRRGDVAHDALEQLRHALARLRRNHHGVVGVDADDVLELLFDLVGVRRREVYLVEHRHELEVEVRREVAVGHSLRLDALRCVDDEHRALAGRERARDLVGEVDVARRVDEVQHVGAPVARLVVHAHGDGLYRYAALALEVEHVEQLRLHVALVYRARRFEQTVCERRLAVVDVGDDAEISEILQFHKNSSLPANPHCILSDKASLRQ